MPRDRISRLAATVAKAVTMHQKAKKEAGQNLVSLLDIMRMVEVYGRAPHIFSHISNAIGSCSLRSVMLNG